jgi:hypothetical protein
MTVVAMTYIAEMFPAQPAALRRGSDDRPDHIPATAYGALILMASCGWRAVFVWGLRDRVSVVRTKLEESPRWLSTRVAMMKLTPSWHG